MEFQFEKAFAILILGASLLAARAPAVAAQNGCASLFEKAQSLLEQKQAQDAGRLLQAAVRKCPESAQAYDLLGISYDQQALYPQAQEAYRKAIALSPGWAGFHNNLAVSYYRAGKVKNAVEEFHEALRLDPHNRFAALNLAQNSLEQKNYAQAVSYFQQAGAEHSEDAAVLLGLAKAYGGAGNTRAALETAQKASRLAASDPKIHFSLGLLLAEQRQYAGAVAQFQDIVPAERDFAVYQNIGMAFAKLGRASEAQTAFEEAMRLNPSSPEPYLGLGQTYPDSHESGQRVYWLSQAHERAPGRVDITYALAEALIQANQFNRAGSLLTEAIKQQPRNAALYQAMGDLNDRQHQDEQALQAYQQALKYDPQRVDAHLGLASLYQRLGKTREAQAEFKRTLEADPGNGRAFAGLGRIALQEGRLDNAEADLQKALKAAAGNTEAMQDLAAVLIRRSQYTEAETILQKLLHLDPNNSRGHYLLGQVFLKLGRKEEAGQEFKRSQQIKAVTPATP